MKDHLTRLSYPLAVGSPAHPVLHGLEILPRNRISEGKDYNTSVITVENHCGTHVDGPAHFIEGAKTIGEFGPEYLHFSKPLVWDCPRDADGLIDADAFEGLVPGDWDMILLRTGFGRFREPLHQDYLVKNPGLGPEGVRVLRQKLPLLRCVGIDSVSMARYGRPAEAVATHQTAFRDGPRGRGPVLFVEDMDLRPLGPGVTLVEVTVVPWQILGIDSTPCTVLATIRQ